jgi:hypothetical protein
MADNPQQQEVWGLGLQIAEFVNGIRKASDSYKQLQATFDRPILVKLDTSSLANLSVIVGARLREVMGTINTTLTDGFVMLASRLDTLSDDIATKAGETAKKTGKAVTDGVKASADAASEASKAAVKGAEQDLSRLEDSLKARLESLKRLRGQLNDPAALDASMRNSNLGFALTDPSAETGLLSEDAKGRLYASQQIQQQIVSMIREQAGLEQTILRFEDEKISAIEGQAKAQADVNKQAVQTFELLSAQRAKQQQLERTGAAEAVVDEQKEAAALRQINEQATRLYNQIVALRAKAKDSSSFTPLTGADQLIRTLPESGQSALNGPLADQLKREAQNQIASEKQRQAELRNSQSESNKLLAIHQGIGASILSSVANIAKWFIIFRTVRDVAKEVESLIGTFLSLGVQYTKETQQQQIAMAGVLGATVNIVDANGKQLEGAARLTALQEHARLLWSQMETMAQGTAASVKDLVQIYDSLSVPATRLRGTSEDIQKLTVMTAGAAEALGITYKEAATQVANILEGKGQNSSLGKVLGFTPQELKDLKDTPQLLSELQKRMEPLQAVAAQMGGTLENTTARLTRFFAQLSAQVEAPVLELMQKFLSFIDKMKDTPQLQNFFTLVRTGMGEVATELQSFGRSIVSQGSDGFQPIVKGLTDVIMVAVKFAEAFAQAAIYVTEFVARNGEMVKSFVWVAAGLTALNLLNNFGKTVLDVSTGTGLLGRTLFMLVGPIEQMISKLGGVVAQSGFAITGVQGLTTALVSLGSATVIGAVVYGLGTVYQQLMSVKQAADDAAAARDKLANHDVPGAILKQSTQMSSDDPLERGAAFVNVFANAKKSALGGLPSGVDLDNLADKLRDAREQYQALNTELATNQKLSAAQRSIVQIEVADRKNQIDQMEKTISVLQSLKNHVPAIEESIAALQKKAQDPGTLLERMFGRAEINQQQADIMARALQKIVAQLRQTSDVAASISDRANTPTTKTTPKPFTIDVKPEQGPFVDYAAKQMDVENNALNNQLKVAQAMRSADLINEKDYVATVNAIEEQREEKARALYSQELNDYELYVSTHKVTEDAHQKKLEDFATREAKLEQDSITRKRLTQIEEQKLQNQLATQTEIANEQITSKIASIFGNTEVSVSASLNKMADEIEKTLKRAGKSPDAAKAVADRLRALIPGAAEFAEAEKDFKSYEQQLSRIQDLQRKSDDDFTRGQESIQEHIQKTNTFRQQTITLLEKERDAIMKQMLVGVESGGISPEKLEALQKLFDELGIKIDHAHKSAKNFNDVVVDIGDIGKKLAEATNGIGAFGDGVSRAVGFMSDLFQRASAVQQLIQSFRQFMSDSGIGGGIVGLFKAFGGSKDDGTGNVSGFAGSGAAAAYTYGASLAIQAAITIYKSAVADTTNVIEDGLNAITKALNAGTMSLGDSLAHLETQRQQMMAQYSDSKSGRKALEDTKADYENTRAQLVQRIKGIQDAFKEQIAGMQAGSGPFGDFARKLMDLNKTAQDYIGTFAQGTEEYKQAVVDVKNFLQLQLDDAKNQLEENMTGFEQTALSAADNVFSELQQQQSLYEQLHQIDVSRTNLADQRVQLEKDQAKLQEDRLAQAQKERDLEQQINDIIKKAADDEAAVKRQGVMEAQLTIAEQRASQIAEIRNKAIDDLNQAKQQLSDLQKDTSLDDRQQQILKSYTGLAQSGADLDSRESDITSEIRLSAIRLSTDKQIAAIEGGIFNIAGDRFQIAQRAAQLEVQQAQMNLQKWQQTKALIDAIVDKGNGVIFNPPPGFPQIKLTIANLIIDNSDNSSAQTQINNNVQPGSPYTRTPDFGVPVGTARPIPGAPPAPIRPRSTNEAIIQGLGEPSY